MRERGGILNRAALLCQLWRHFGPSWLAYRLAYAARSRTGLLRLRTPPVSWASTPQSGFLDNPALAEPEAYLEHRRTRGPAFFFAPGDSSVYLPYLESWDGDGDGPVEEADQITEGELCYFRHDGVRVGFPPDWHENPYTGQRTPTGRHWSQISDFDHGDIKVVWEASRFGFVYPLVRAYWRTGREAYAEAFWQLVEDWQAHNPPQRGANWRCGQEVSFRVLAWCFGLYGFLASAATSPERVAALGQMIAVSGRRLEANLGYALSQRNNHGVSEGVGLWTIGALFPEFRRAPRWRRVGRRVLETLSRRLIYDDGSFCQHSVNYHRLMLHDYLWALRLADLHGQPFSAELRARVGRAAAFLYAIQDEAIGRVPCYGQNDGSLILPLSNCDYQDFRPVVQATHYLCTGDRRYGDGPWDEDLLWLFGPRALSAPVVGPARADLEARVGGYYTLRSESGFCFVRCASFRDRPSQADMLHLDLWWRGQNVALDAGTYSYNGPPPWDGNPLAHSAYHNVVTVDGRDQMERAGRFLWLPWLHGVVNYCCRSPEGGALTYWEGEHDGYHRLQPPVRHRRAVLRLAPEGWLVLDSLESGAEHEYRLHWLFPDWPYSWNQTRGELDLHTDAGRYFVQTGAVPDWGLLSLVKADQRSPRGWRSAYYNDREPALSLVLATRAASGWFWTLFGPDPCQVTLAGDHMQVVANTWRASVTLASSGGPLIASARLDGLLCDCLVVSP